MGIKSHIREALNSFFEYYGCSLIDSQLVHEWQKIRRKGPIHNQSCLPEDAAGYLRLDNPRFIELQARYAACNTDVTDPLMWSDTHVSPDEVLHFRGDNAFVWQHRDRGLNMDLTGYALATYYVKSIDKLGLLDKLKEDDLFGIFCYFADARLVSRDLLDSIIEIYFLETYLRVSSSKSLNVLDIGGGYGRLAHRMVTALPNIATYFCTDGVPVSTFISEYYLRYRNVEDRAKVVPLDEVEHILRNHRMDIALNIHSFSECRIPAIEWWLSILAKHKVKNLMIVPNSNELRTEDSIDFGDIVEKHGYRRIAKDPKYRDPAVQKYAMSPTYFYLFELR